MTTKQNIMERCEQLEHHLALIEHTLDQLSKETRRVADDVRGIKYRMPGLRLITNNEGNEDEAGQE